jgi:carbon starvation protein
VRTANTRTIVIWTLVGLVGATGWAVLALARGEDVSAADGVSPART